MAVTLSLHVKRFGDSRLVEARKLVTPESINFHPCNWFKDPWITDADAYFMSNVLHDWPTEKATEILKCCHEAMATDSSLYIYECLLDEDCLSPRHTVIFDLLMFANHKSQQFTKTQLQEVLDEAGFTQAEIVYQFGYYSLLKTNKK